MAMSHYSHTPGSCHPLSSNAISKRDVPTSSRKRLCDPGRRISHFREEKAEAEIPLAELGGFSSLSPHGLPG